VWSQHVEIISPALEPQSTVKSTKRAVIVGVALELFYKRIISMPSKAKLDLCHYARRCIATWLPSSNTYLFYYCWLVACFPSRVVEYGDVRGHIYLRAKLSWSGSWAVKGCGWSNEVETIARSALPPPPSVNPAYVRGEGSSAALGAALTIGKALSLEQEPLDPPPFQRSHRSGKYDVTGITCNSNLPFP
jgi:hypothetical protein